MLFCCLIFKMKVNFLLTLFLVTLLTVLGDTSRNLHLETNEVSDNVMSANINWLFDRFLSAYKMELLIRGETEMPIQNFEEHFSYKVVTFNIVGYMSVIDGSIKNLTSLQRTGDAVLDRDGSNVTLTAHLGMTDFQVKYDQYELSLMGLTQRGTIHATVGTNSVCLKILITVKPKCKVQLQCLKLESLGDIDVSITGLGPMNGLMDDISSWVVTHITHSYRSNLQNLVFGGIEKAIQEADLCHYF